MAFMQRHNRLVFGAGSGPGGEPPSNSVQATADMERALERLRERRRFIKSAVAGTTLVVLGAAYVLDDRLTREARAQTRPDGRARLPPGQRVISRLKPMGGQEGDPSLGHYRLRIHGEVEKPYSLNFADLVKMTENKKFVVDVHCVTGWSVMGAEFGGVSLQQLAERAKLKKSAHHVIFEAAHGYTSNVSLRDALKPNVLVAHKLDGRPLPRAHGAPVRAVVPDLYFWKSAKWLTGIRFVSRDKPGYWETRGYNNHADPWLEERYA